MRSHHLFTLIIIPSSRLAQGAVRSSFSFPLWGFRETAIGGNNGDDYVCMWEGHGDRPILYYGIHFASDREANETRVRWVSTATVGWCGSIKRRVPPRSGSCTLSLLVCVDWFGVRSVVVVVREQACFEGSGFRALDPAPHPAPFLATYQLLLLRVPSSKISQREQAMGERANSSQRLLYNG